MSPEVVQHCFVVVVAVAKGSDTRMVLEGRIRLNRMIRTISGPLVPCPISILKDQFYLT